MNVHIGSDDKFLDYVIEISKKIECSRPNKFAIFKLKEESELKYVKSKEIEVVNIESEDLSSIFNGSKFPQMTHLYVHYFNLILYPYINLIPKNIQVVWCFWGEDGFGLSGVRKKFLDSKSLEANNESISFYLRVAINIFKNPKRSLRFFYNEKLKKEKDKVIEQEFTQVVKRVDWFAHFIYEDYLFLKKRFGFKAKFLPFSYCSIESIMDFNLPEETVVGENILLGNSANYMNNHWIGLEAIKRIGLPEASYVYCPLSYSTTSYYYLNNVLSKGKELFNKSFVPITSFMEKKEYHNILLSCGYAVMPHYRSQAWGNIIILLWNGSAVFLSIKSSLYKLLKNEYKLNIFSIENDLKSGVNFKQFKLSNEEIFYNRNALLENIGESKKESIIQEYLGVK